MKKTLIFLLFLLFFQFPELSAQTVFINELMSNNQDIIDENGEQEDWIELYNASENAVNLAGWALSDDEDTPQKYVFTNDFFIAAGGFRLLWADKDEGNNHLSFKLSSTGEKLILSRPNGEIWTVEDAVDFPALLPNISYARTTDGGSIWQKNAVYSPNNSNQNNRAYYPATIEFSLLNNFYATPQTLILNTLAPEAEIRYTTDGSLPNSSSPLYTTPLLLENSQMISAIVISDDGEQSLPTHNFYAIGVSHEIPVLHLQTNADNLWDDEKGIYIIGTNGKFGNCATQARNWNQTWRRPAHFTFYESNGQIGFERKAEMKISGGCSRRQRMKSFNIFLEDDEATNYALFSQLDYTDYRRFKLRNSGSDFTKMMLRDGALQEILRDQIDLDLTAYRPAVLYINGVYFGIYNIREFFNEDYIQQHYGLGEVDMIRNPWMYYQEVKEGTPETCDALNEWVSENDLLEQENYQYFQDKVELNQMINYWLSEMYVANFDWPDNNLMMWRDRMDVTAKWRFMTYDLDLSSGANTTQSPANYNSLNHVLYPNSDNWPNRPPSTLWLRKLTQNPDFLHEFAQRHLSIGQIVFAPERVHSVVDSLVQNIRPEMSAHIDFWNDTPDNWSIDDRIPSGGSVAVWEEEINIFKDFFEDRLSFVFENYRSEFGFEKTYKLTLNVDEYSNGKVVLHTNKMTAPYQYSGRYFSEIPLRVEAVADSSYVFVKWLELENSNAQLSFVGMQDQILTPIFVKESDFLGEDSPLKLVIFPTLADNLLYFETVYAINTTAQVEIISAIGQTVFTKQILVQHYPEKRTIDLHSLANGIYFLRIKSQDSYQTQKFVIQR